MKKIIRYNMFETNSSSTHSLTIKIKTKNESWETEEEIRAKDSNSGYSYSSYIYRQIRSKYAKILILYQSFVNFYTGTKYELIDRIGQIDKVNYTMPDYPALVYMESYKKYISYDASKFDEYDNQIIKEMINQIDDLDISLKNIKEYLIEEVNKLDEDDKKSALSCFDRVDKSPTNDETAINNFFSNSLLDTYNDYSGFMDFVYDLNVKKDDIYLNTVKRALEDDVYFDTKEGLMAYDDMPRIL